ncbi:MAG TPA: radical SAM protein [Candidatus Cloacimonadota bacterium]|nr:radical SAM protein [Candidatus Cloacimonadota bacterium]
MKENGSSGKKTLIFPLFIPQEGCPLQCVYCDQRKISGQDGYDPLTAYIQTRDFIQNHPGREKQIAFYGGSFTALPPSRREDILRDILPLLDDTTTIRISTHPLAIDSEVLSWAAAKRIRTIELGIQDFQDEVLRRSGRGYTEIEAVKACELVQEAGFELGIQLMPGLPGSDARSLDLNKELLNRLRPEFLRLYPLVVIRGTPLAEIYAQGKYRPLSLEEAITICADYTEFTRPLGIRIIKLGLPSGIAESEIVAGPWHPAFGEFVRAELLIREISLDYQADQTIFLDRSQRALLSGHGGKYQKILCDRLKICIEKIYYR